MGVGEFLNFFEGAPFVVLADGLVLEHLLKLFVAVAAFAPEGDAMLALVLLALARYCY